MDIFKVNENKTYLIESIYGQEEFYVYFIIISVIYSVIMIMTIRSMDKPHIQCRSPILMQVIFVGCYLDTITKLLIRYLDYNDIGWKCKLALLTRLVFHNVIVIFIVVRIKRVHTVNKL